jgi:hypothetical protein
MTVFGSLRPDITSLENDSHKIGSVGKLVKGVDGDGKMSLFGVGQDFIKNREELH